jgi:hypothetical protein
MHVAMHNVVTQLRVLRAALWQHLLNQAPSLSEICANDSYHLYMFKHDPAHRCTSLMPTAS